SPRSEIRYPCTSVAHSLKRASNAAESRTPWRDVAPVRDDGCSEEDTGMLITLTTTVAAIHHKPSTLAAHHPRCAHAARPSERARLAQALEGAGPFLAGGVPPSVSALAQEYAVVPQSSF